jgi:D-alanyl-D-alanine carboxypeptidase
MLTRSFVALALIAGAMLALSASTSAAQVDRSKEARLVRAADALVAAGAPGVVVYMRDGDRVVRVARGYSDLAQKRSASAANHFRIGSVTKSFVAAVVLQLVHEGKLSLNDTVERWLPGVVPRGERVTLRQLLSHTSGIYDYFEDPRVLAPYLKGNSLYDWKQQTLVRIGVDHKPNFAPGTPGRWSYSNTGYQLVGMIVERVTGHTLRRELASRIFRPLGLGETSFPSSAKMPAPYAHGYTALFGTPLKDVSIFSVSTLGPAGAIVSTVGDVAHFYRALYRGRLFPKPLLRAMTTDVAHAPNAQGHAIGLGLWREPLSCSLVWGHDGDWLGYWTRVWGSADGTRQVVISVNADTDSLGEAGSAAHQRLENLAYCG